MPKPHKSIRIFQNDHLEKLTHVHPVTPLILWTPIFCWMLYRAVGANGLPVAGVLAMIVVGFFSFTVAEYFLHRYVFHFDARTPAQKRFQFLIHGLHHDDPVDPTRLLMPPFPAIVIGLIFYVIFRGVLGPIWCDPTFAGFVAGYLCYDYTHFAIHHFTPRTRFGKLNKQHHMLHHYATPDARWGVSSPLWDYVFGTAGTEAPARPEAPARARAKAPAVVATPHATEESPSVFIPLDPALRRQPELGHE